MSVATDISKLILTQAAQVPGNTWDKIKKASKLYMTGYAQQLVDIAKGLKDGDLQPSEAKMNAQNAQLLLAMAVANAQEITLFEVQTFLNNVIGILKTTINNKLPIPIL